MTYTVIVWMFLFSGPDSVTPEFAFEMFENVQMIYERDLGVELRLAAIETLPDPTVALQKINHKQRLQKFHALQKATRSRQRIHLALGVTGPLHYDSKIWCTGVSYLRGYLQRRRNFAWCTAKVENAEGFERSTLSAIACSHEGGHNLGAEHDGDNTGAMTCISGECVPVPDIENIMHPAAKGWATQGLNLPFTKRSRNQIRRHLRAQIRKFCAKRERGCKRKVRKGNYGNQRLSA